MHCIYLYMHCIIIYINLYFHKSKSHQLSDSTGSTESLIDDQEITWKPKYSSESQCTPALVGLNLEMQPGCRVKVSRDSDVDFQALLL